MEKKSKFCRTCLSSERLMYPLAKLKLLLKELSLQIKDTGEVCWECKRIMDNFYKFKIQVSEAQQLLHRHDEGHELPSLSKLNVGPRHCYDSLTFFPMNVGTRAAPPVVIKQEPVEIIDDYSTNEDMALDVNLMLNENEPYGNSIVPNRNDPAHIWSDLPQITSVESISEQQTSIQIESQTNTTSSVSQEQEKSQNVLSKQKQNASVSNVPNVNNVEATQNISVKVERLELEEEETGRKNAQSPDANDEVTILGCKQELDQRLKSTRPLNESLERELWKKSVMLVYNRLRGHKYASRFVYRIRDDVAPEYSQVVKRPMDLATIRKNIRSGAIRTTAEFQRDVLLMLSNAMMYNSSDHCVYEMAHDMHKEAQYQLGLLLKINEENRTPVSICTPLTRTKRRMEENENTAKKPKLSYTTPKSQNSLPQGILNAAKSGAKAHASARKQSRAKPRGKSFTCARKSDESVTPTVTTESCSRVTPKVEKEIAIVIPKMEFTHYTELIVKRKSGRPKRESYLAVPTKLTTTIVQNTPQPTRKSERIKIKKEPMEIIHIKKEPKVAIKREKKQNKRKSNVRIGNGHNDDLDLCVAITSENCNEFRDQANLVKRLLEETIRSLALNAKNIAPRFRGEPIIGDGVIKLWCEDKKTLKWLSNTVKKLPRSLGKLTVVKQADLPKKLHSALSVPGSDNEEVIRKILKAQNPWAQIDSWSFYSAEQRGENMFFALGIPSTVIPTLLARQRRLAYNLGSVFILFYSSNGRLRVTPEPTWF